MSGELFVISKGDHEKQAAGSWWHWKPGGDVFVKCPQCEYIGMLGHDVAHDGTVTPSLDCPTTGCSFHKFVKLEGWIA